MGKSNKVKAEPHKTVLLVDKNAVDPANIKKLEDAGYIVVEKAPGRTVEALY